MKNIPLRCPCPEKCELDKAGNGYICTQKHCVHNNEASKFSEIDGCPILVSETRTDTICDAKNTASLIKRPNPRFLLLRKFLFGNSPVTTKNCANFIEKTKQKSMTPKVLVIGGGEAGLGTSQLWDDKVIELHCVDIYRTENVDLICDGHYLPLASGYYDGVWIQAVLEHVVEPSQVVKEIYRVLDNDGIVYAETPFMQHVHEGAYDFTRFSMLGHRYLFRQFKLLEMGGVRGAELVFAWSVKYLILALTRSQLLSKLIGALCTLLVRPLSNLISLSSYYDSSSAVYFLGKKCKDHNNLKHKDLVKLYKGDLSK